MPEPSLTRYDAQPGWAPARRDPDAARRETALAPGRRPAQRLLRRSLAMRREIAQPARMAGLSTWLLRYAVAGWNDPARPSPVADARWAPDQQWNRAAISNCLAMLE